MRDAVCYKSQRKGHMQRVCTATSGSGGATRHEQGALQASMSKSRSTKYVNDDESNDESASYRSEGSSDEAFGLNKVTLDSSQSGDNE